MHGGEPAAEETWRREVYLGCFAPSPTDSLHFGYLVAALGSYLDAWAAGGPADESAVRIDLDRPREVLEVLGAACRRETDSFLAPCAPRAEPSWSVIGSGSRGRWGAAPGPDARGGRLCAADL